MNTRRLSCGALGAAFLFTACSDGGSNGSTPRIDIDQSGGRIVATDGPLRGTEIEVPPGAIDGPRTFGLDPTAQPRLPLEYVPVGPSIEFGPLGTGFGGNLVATLIVDVAALPAGTRTDQLGVLLWQEDPAEGRVAPLNSYDSATGRARLLISATTRMLAVARVDEPSLPMNEFFGPLNGVEIDFDDGTTLTVTRTLEEPNVGDRPITRLDFDGRGRYWAIDTGGRLIELGRYDRLEDFQEIGLTPRVLAESIARDGEIRRSTFEFARYDRFGGEQPNSWGQIDVMTRYEYLPRFETPLGTFRDVVQLELFAADPFGVDRLQARFQLARGIGVIGYEFPEDPASGRIQRGTVEGQPIVAR